MQKNSVGNEILLNIMYTGTYLDDNIGHEIINLFKDDKGRNFIYVLPHGSMRREHNDRVKTIILVRRCNTKLFEILAKAENLEQIVKIRTTHTSKDEIERVKNEQISYIRENNIRYGGVLLNKILRDNTFITFSAKKVTKVAKPLYITINKDFSSENCIYLQDVKHFPSQSPKMYICEGSLAFQILENIINTPSNWNKSEELRKIDINDISTNSNKNNFIDIIRRPYDELVYSNLFQYIFNANKKGFLKFAQDVLGITTPIQPSYTIQREERNIDLLISDENNAIVIENKVKSGINGITSDFITSSKEINSQLNKYYQYLENTFPNKSRYYYIFTPDYNSINLDSYYNGKKYQLIKYSQLYQFFKKHEKLYRDAEYFPEFLYALKKHIKNVDSNKDEEMYDKFVKAIKKLTT